MPVAEATTGTNRSWGSAESRILTIDEEAPCDSATLYRTAVKGPHQPGDALSGDVQIYGLGHRGGTSGNLRRVLFTAVSLILAAAIIWLIGTASATYRVDDFVTAFMLALSIAVAGWLLMIPVGAVDASLHRAVMGSCAPDCAERVLYLRLTSILFDVAEKIVLLLLVGVLLPGVTVRGVAGAVAIAVGLTAVHSAALPAFSYLLSTP